MSTADCERGFSVMNLQQTDLRNSLATETVCNLLMISINGPALEFWQPRPYIVRWLQNGHRGALNKPTGPPKQKTKLASSAQLFLTTACTTRRGYTIGDASLPTSYNPRYDLLLMNGKSVKPVIILHYYRDLYSYADRKIMHF